MARPAKIDLSNLTALRKKLGENQTIFWGRFGVTQSGGSRYEKGQEMPAAAKILLALYVKGLVDDATLAKMRAALGL